MRRLFLIVILVAAAIPAVGARRVTVAELQQILTTESTAHKSDSAIAASIGTLELTEQLTSPTLKRIIAELKPGTNSALALALLADSSALLAPPADEILKTPKPDMDAQRAMIRAAINYIANELHKLPDFLATRATRSYDDRPLVISHTGYQGATGLHPAGTFARQITYRNGREVIDPTVTAAADKHKPAAGPAGLATWGEFGPILGVVLTDATKGKVTWNGWEHSPTGQIAVFHYEVPAAASHYLIDYGSEWKSYRGTPGYHGDLALDPAAGTVLRLTLEADLSNQLLTNAGIAVEYGNVEIDGKSYVCPIRSVAVSLEYNPAVRVIGGSAMLKRINEVSFTNYHKFGSTARIFAGSPETEPPAQPSATPSQEPVVTPATETASATTAPAPANESAPSSDLAASSAPAISPTPIVNSEPPAAPSSPMTDASTEALQETLLQSMPVFKANTREVIVDVVVTKGNGDPVLGIRQEDFEIKEDGKPQTLGFFEEHTAKALPPGSQKPLPSLPPNTYTNVPPAPESDSVNVLLLDMLNTSMRDQAFVHNNITDFLKKMQPGTRVAIFTLGSKLRFIQGFTSDTSLLLAALNDKKNGVSPQKDVASRDRTDTSDDAADVERMRMISSGPMGQTSSGIAAWANAQADLANFEFGERITMTFEALNYLAHYLAGVPGRKNLLWFSSSFPVIIFPTVAQREDFRNQPQMRGFLDHIKETADIFTVAKVAVYPINAEGMMEEHILEANNAGPGSPEGGGRGGSVMAPYIAGSAERAGVISSMEQLASDTGGKAYFNTNDLNGAAQRAMNDGANYYTLTYSPTNQKMDGQYRRIDVHLKSGYYKLSYRRGYNADKYPVLDAKTATGGDSKAAGDPLRPLLKYGLPGATGILYGARALPVDPQPQADATRAGQNPNLEGPSTRYAIDFFIRWTDIDFQAAPDKTHQGKIEVGLMAFDRQGKAVNWEGGTQVMNIRPAIFDAIQKSGVPAHMEIDLPNEDITLVTGVYDLATGKAGTLQIPVHSIAPKRSSVP
jgi:VWFA-related protein